MNMNNSNSKQIPLERKQLQPLECVFLSLVITDSVLLHCRIVKRTHAKRANLKLEILLLSVNRSARAMLSISSAM